MLTLITQTSLISSPAVSPLQASLPDTAPARPGSAGTSLLTFRAYLAAPQKFRLYFFEVNSGSQTRGFAPTDYVDITATREKKRAALFAHKSQNGEEIYRKHHEIMENYRGREIGVAAAEAFVHLARDAHSGDLPGL